MLSLFLVGSIHTYSRSLISLIFVCYPNLLMQFLRDALQATRVGIKRGQMGLNGHLNEWESFQICKR